jgi:mono/diheme cytochrome c family protein
MYRCSVSARVVVLLVAGCTGSAPHVARETVSDPGEAVFRGFTNPKIKCYTCHAADGSGTKQGPALRIMVHKMTDATVRTLILDGGATMPGYRDLLRNYELDDLMRWLRAKFGGPPG